MVSPDPPPRPRRRRTAKPADAVTGRVRAHDPFELIRWLALSQPDPRKALAELVQNSLDAGAHKIRVTRLREKGLACLRIFDDGSGVIPELDRPEALRYIATHIGHSRKRDLSPEQRLQLMTQGQYGIGLLGFWSLGQVLEMRTSVPGQRAHRLVLHRDKADFLIEPLRGRLPLDECWTEIVVVDLHRGALGALVGRRAADYLAAELRGQLLAREVELLIEDRMARGRAQRLTPVRPPRFLGERLEGIGPVDVPGHPPVRFEIYLSGEDSAGAGGSGGAGDEPRGLAVYSAGTLVAESFHALAPLGLDRPPWNDARLSGMVDFPAFQVAPGSRRGIVVNEAAEQFARALRVVEPTLMELLADVERRRADEMDRSLIRDLQRAFRDFYRQRPRYALLPVEGGHDRGAGPGGKGAAGGEEGEGRRDPAEHGGEPAAEAETAAATSPEEEEAAAPAPLSDQTEYLFPPGPLAAVRIVPALVRVECGGERRVRAIAVDDTERVLTEPVEFVWTVDGPVGFLVHAEGDVAGAHMRLRAASEAADGTLAVVGRAGGREAHAEAPVEVLFELPGAGRTDEGIPEPEFVHQPGAGWRSRMQDGRWQVNSGHREYRAIAEQSALKLRYLAMLFAKEVVLRSHQDPRLERPLEQLIEVAAYADRNLATKRGPRRRGKATAG
jgi:hypothetical protein